jgi:hypothetical protein
MSAVSMTAAACGGSVTIVGDRGESDAATVEDGSGTGSSGGGSSSSSGGGTSSSSGISIDDGSWGGAAYGGFIGPLYGGGFFDAAYGGYVDPDAGLGDDASTAQDSGPEDASSDHPFIVPPYGIPPGH